MVEKGSPAPGDTSQPSIQRAFSIKAHVSNLGWQSPVYEGMTVGTTGRNLAVEAVEIKLTGDLAKHYDVVYRAHVQSKGWLDWVKSGECAGTTGEALHLEALEVRLVEKS